MAENGFRRNGGARARRCLFPPGDGHERNIQDLDDMVKREEEAQAEEFKKRWNFDIQNETPNPGRYEWEKIRNDQSRPSTSVSHLPAPEPRLAPRTVTARKITDQEKCTAHKSDADTITISNNSQSQMLSSSCEKEADSNENIPNLPPDCKKFNTDAPKPSTSVSPLPSNPEYELSIKTVNTRKDPTSQKCKGVESNASITTLGSGSDSVTSSSPADEKDLNENIVPVAAKRKTASTLHEEDSSSKEAKRARPP